MLRFAMPFALAWCYFLGASEYLASRNIEAASARCAREAGTSVLTTEEVEPLATCIRKTLTAWHHAYAAGNTGGVFAYSSPVLR